MQERVLQHPKAAVMPLDSTKLDRLIEAAGIYLLLATSKHNVQYLLGAERAMFFDYMDAIGISRYLPVFVYPKGLPEKAAFIGHRLEAHQRTATPPWVLDVRVTTNGSLDAIA